MRRAKTSPVLLAVLLALFFLRGEAHGDDLLEEVSITGPSENRVDLVITGDGYTAAQADLFRGHVEDLLDEVFDETPWSGYMGYFNIHQVVTQSAESGADHPSQGIYKDTYFDAQFDYYGIDRLTWANVSKVINVVTGLVPEVDQIILIINDPAYGGSGGSLAMVSAHPSAGRILLHELGHSFGNLADEYTDPYPEYPAGDPEPNVDFDHTFDDIKWNLWIETQTLLPSLVEDAIDNYYPVGAYEGARYLTTGIYRPAPNCMMKSLSFRYCDVCREAMVQGFYGYVDPLDGVSPTDFAVVVDRGRTDLLPVTFEAEAVSTLTGDSLYVGWSLNDQPQEEGSEFAFDPVTLGLENGEHLLEVEVHDPTLWVRLDPHERLISKHQWSITVVGEGPDGGVVSFDGGSSFSDAGEDDGGHLNKDGGTHPGGDGGEQQAESVSGACGCRHSDGSGYPPLLVLILALVVLVTRKKAKCL